MSDLQEFFGAAIATVTRADLLAAGQLIEPDQALVREARFPLPLAFTAAAWADAVAWSDADNERKGTVQDETGRLWDVLTMARARAGQRPDQQTVMFPVCRVPREGRGRMPRNIMLKLTISSGDDGRPVLTIMTPHED